MRIYLWTTWEIFHAIARIGVLPSAITSCPLHHTWMNFINLWGFFTTWMLCFDYIMCHHILTSILSWCWCWNGKELKMEVKEYWMICLWSRAAQWMGLWFRATQKSDVSLVSCNIEWRSLDPLFSHSSGRRLVTRPLKWTFIRSSAQCA